MTASSFRMGSSSRSKRVLTEANTRLSEGNDSESRRESLWEVRLRQGTHGHLLATGAVRLLGLSEALGLLFP
ncbi:hypothetical protein CDL15_Pgr008350 [Punica granatum]|uniref:Uncharacterized protein n=1 Tax=Punica granatum TaxID=22663 RepID=A0A218XEC2_PUNGR|nr:hypothetical protein CDL15_Pgr008350 [Punica granatum]